MIAFLRGQLFSCQTSSLILEVNGVGYRVQIPDNLTLPALGQELLLYTHQIWREDSLTLYGFANPEDLNLFQLLLGVSGIGPKGALALLSALGGDSIVAAINQENAALLAKAPGIGKKTAQRLLLELKDKLKQPVSSGKFLESSGSSDSEAVEALLGLGYSLWEANGTVKKIQQNKPGLILEELLTLALQDLGRNKI